MQSASKNSKIQEIYNSLVNYRIFITSWAKNPRLVGSVLPSQPTLTNAMANLVDLSVEGSIIEIGAGTGVVTKPLLKRVGRDRLLVIERNEHLFNILRKTFPDANILLEDAQHLPQIMARHGVVKINSIVSSLPFLTIPDDLGEMIFAEMVRAIGKNGKIIQFSFGLKSPISKEWLENHGMKGSCAKTIFAHIPPAKVWVYTAA